MPVEKSGQLASSLFGRISASTRSSLMSSRDYKATVQLLDDNETIYQEFKKNADAQQVLDYVCEFLNIVEKDYFGLRYQDARMNRYWVDLNKPISKQIRGPNIGLRFRVRFYPSDVSVLKEEITRYQLFVQLQRDLLHGRMFCSQKEVTDLGGLILQSVIGDYDPDHHFSGYVSEYKLLLRQTEKLEEKIAEAHQTFKGLTAAEAEMEFLRRASKLETYGFDPYPVTNNHVEPLYVGVTHRGVYIYRFYRLKHRITWDELEKVDYIGKSLLITPIASYVSPFSSSADLNETPNLHGGGGKSISGATLKLHCKSVTFAKHLWRHILSQQAFFTENDAKHIKPKFSKPRIPLLSRGSSFRFPTARVLHEIEQDSQVPLRTEPNFTRYTLQRHPPRQYQMSTSKYHTLPASMRLGNNVNTTIPEDGPLVEEEEELEHVSVLQDLTAPAVLSEHTDTRSDADMQTQEGCSKEEQDLCTTREELVLSPPVKWLSPAQKETSNRWDETLPLDESGNIERCMQPMLTSTPKQNTSVELTGTSPAHREPDSGDLIPAQMGEVSASKERDTVPELATIQTVSVEKKRNGKMVAVLNVVFSFILMAILVIAVIIALFESRPSWLQSSETMELVRHETYEPLRAHFMSLYERFFVNN